MSKPKLPVRSALLKRSGEPSEPRKRGRRAFEKERRGEVMNALDWYSRDGDDASLDGLTRACVACLEADHAEAYAMSLRAIYRLGEELMAIMAKPGRDVASAAALLARELNLLGDANDNASLADIAERFRKAK
jgi:hypothetical protein